ncbi:MAG: hypothetical protein ACYTHN_11170 [Planctomycetota bacterium]|jgi:hypothetical protein
MKNQSTSLPWILPRVLVFLMGLTFPLLGWAQGEKEHVSEEPGWAKTPPGREGVFRFVLVRRSNLESLAKQRAEMFAKGDAERALAKRLAGAAGEEAAAKAGKAGAERMRAVRRAVSFRMKESPPGKDAPPGNSIATAWVLWEVEVEVLLAALPEASRKAALKVLVNPVEKWTASLSGNTVLVKPLGLTFELPGRFLEWFRKFRTNLHFTSEALAAVKDGAGEWDTEYGRVVNRALPFERCVAHVGTEGWGRKAVAYSDLQVRIYILSGKPAEVEGAIKKMAKAEIEAITGKAPDVAEGGSAGPWRKVVFGFDRWYHDYGARAFTDFRIRGFGNRTVVFACMYTNYQSQEERIGAILKSVRCPEGGSEKEGAHLKAWLELESHIGKDLRKLDAEKRKGVETLITGLLGSMPGLRKEEIPGFDSWSILRYPAGEGRAPFLLIFQALQLVPVPSDFPVRLSRFSSEGRPLGSTTFSVGWRLFPQQVEVLPAGDRGFPVLVVRTEPAIAGRDVAKQYYTFIGDEIALVRIENAEGEGIRNIFGAPNHTLGPPVPVRSVKAWERALASKELPEVLRTLVWLAGVHRDPAKPIPKVSHESQEDAKFVLAFRSREKVRGRLRDLAKSPNPWVREAAEQALKPEYYR